MEAATHNSEGVLAGVYSMDSFMENILNRELGHLAVDIYDVHADNINFYSSDFTYRPYENNNDAIEYEINVADRLWRITFNDTTGYLTFPHLYESYIVLLFGLIITVLSFNSNQERRKKYNKELQQRNDELTELNNQKIVLLKEVHHRVKNNMQSISSLLNMQSRHIDSKDVKEVFNQSKNRIMSMAVVHEMLYKSDDVGKIYADVYVKELTDKITHSFKSVKGDIYCVLAIEPVLLNADTSIPLGLVLTEILTNSLKYAVHDDDEITVEMYKINTLDYKLIVCDQGEGFNFKEKEKENTLGLKLIKRLVSQLNGTLNVGSSSKGTCYTIIFQEIK